MLKFDSFFPSDVAAFVSDRSVDFCLSVDGLDLTQRQKEFIFAQFQLLHIVNIRQMHGDEIVVADKKNLYPREKLLEADAIITNVPDLPIGVRTADCVSMFIYDPKQKAIGVVHAGWKGTQKNIAAKTIHLMCKAYQSEPKDLMVAFGPSIKQCCYQVGKEFHDHFPGQILERKGLLYLDLIAINKKRLMDTGINEVQIFDCVVCTHCDADYFSYRREGALAGRMISVMMLRKNEK